MSEEEDLNSTDEHTSQIHSVRQLNLKGSKNLFQEKHSPWSPPKPTPYPARLPKTPCTHIYKKDSNTLIPNPKPTQKLPFKPGNLVERLMKQKSLKPLEISDQRLRIPSNLSSNSSQNDSVISPRVRPDYKRKRSLDMEHYRRGPIQLRSKNYNLMSSYDSLSFRNTEFSKHLF